ncbi:MAG: glycosyltransferase family 2 protein, partial [Bacteroidia bacterium]|nr:glycosyltransferase family 2 protein [Bacteroidia bacterium]
MNPSPKVYVIIPAFDEEQSIAKVIHDIPKDVVSSVYVGNNNSKDNTEQVAKDAGAIVLTEKRMGYGYACLICMNAIEELPKEQQPDIIVFIDGDYSDFPEKIPELIKPIIENDMDMVIGSRVLGKAEKGSLTPVQKFGNALSTFLIRHLYKVNYTDLGPFRAIKWKQLLALKMHDKTYGWTVEMQAKAAKAGMKTTEIAVPYR